MNYLAHLYLSDREPLELVGNLVVDFLAGPHGYTDARMLAGIRRHHRIDTFTDQHPCHRASCQRIRQTHRRYAPVIVDILYDHFLALSWERWSSRSLLEFSQWAYGLLESQHPHLPDRLQQVLPRMVADNWMLQYREVAGIHRALAGLSRRARRPIDLTEPLADLPELEAELAGDFEAFFPELIAHVRVDGRPLAGE